MLVPQYAVGFAFLGLTLFALSRAGWGNSPVSPPPASVHPVPIATAPATPNLGAAWFERVKPFCNALEVETLYRTRPAPPGPDGIGYGAACFALAGRVDRAAALIRDLAPSEQHRAAGIVFDVAHPVADAGDDRSAGPIMAMVVEFWPNHYMALYHAGISEAALGQVGPARDHLKRFLELYPSQDGWRRQAIEALDRLSAPAERE